MRVRRRRVKWGRVLITVIFLMIIVGGIVMAFEYFFDNDTSSSSEKIDKEEEIIQEKIDQTTVQLEDAPHSFSEFQELEDGEYLTEKGYTLVIQDGIASIDGHLIVNKTYAVPESYQPKNPYQKITDERCINCLEKDVMEAYRLMNSDASIIGLNIYIASGYRSYSYQVGLYQNYSAVSGTDQADTYSARAGHSEHQTGLCFDLNSVDDSFANTDEGKWINENAYLYGFIIRYPKGKESITGYQYEPWHLRYVGRDLASELYNNGDWITLEEYYGISSKY